MRRPGKKIRWAPYVHGAMGAGKTFLAVLLELAMGKENVRILAGSTLLSPFTGWLTGQAVTAIEEVKQPGAHAYDIEEKLKAAIANETVDVHRKGVDPYSAPNKTNYLLLSNYPDGIPIREGDRRYFFVKAAITREEAEELSREGYFSSLFDSCQEAPGAIRRWLMREVEMHPEFDANGRAPKTTARDQAIQLSRSDLDMVIQDAVAGKKAVTSAALYSILKNAGIPEPKTNAVSRALAEHGFSIYKQMRVGGRTTRVYLSDRTRDSRPAVSDDQVRQLLSESLCYELDEADS